MTLESLAYDVLPDVPACPELTVIDHLRRGARQFARDTLAWRKEVERFSVTEALRDIDLMLPQGSRVIEVMTVTIDGKPVRYEFDYNRAIHLAGDEVGLLAVVAALEPIGNFQELPLALERYRDAIADHARYRLLLMPGQNWSNPQHARAYLREYRDRVSDAIAEQATARTGQPLRVKAHPFI